MGNPATAAAGRLRDGLPVSEPWFCPAISKIMAHKISMARLLAASAGQTLK